MCTVSETIIIKGQASFAKLESETLQANGSAGVSQIWSITVTGKGSIGSKRVLLTNGKKEKKRNEEKRKTHLYSKSFDDSIRLTRKPYSKLRYIYLSMRFYERHNEEGKAPRRKGRYGRKMKERSGGVGNRWSIVIVLNLILRNFNRRVIFFSFSLSGNVEDSFEAEKKEKGKGRWKMTD